MIPSEESEIFAQSFDGQQELISVLRSREPAFDEACQDFVLLHLDLAALPEAKNEHDRHYLAKLHESIAGLRAEIERKLRAAASLAN